MRIKVNLIPKQDISKKEINQYHIHSLIWNLLKNTEYSDLHDQPKFKFFCFSELFPINDFLEGEKKTFFISSPSSAFIKFLKEKICENPEVLLNNYKFDIEVEKIFDLRLKGQWISGSPIVLQVEKNVYWSKKYHSLDVFLKRLYENAIKKYKAYYNEDPNVNYSEFFDRISFKKQIAVHIKKHGKDIRIIGTKWLFFKDRINHKNYKFYKFLLDCGLGEKNSLGFGFLNLL